MQYNQNKLNMNNNNIITIGTALKWRGIFSREKTYYQDNIILEAGCIFRCKVLQTQDQPPVRTLDESGHFELINQDIWDVILDMSVYYNKIADIEHYADETMDSADKLKDALAKLETFAKIPIELKSEDDMQGLIDDKQVLPNQMYFTIENS